MTNGKQIHPNLATLVGGRPKPEQSLGLRVISTPRKVTLLFSQAVAFIALDPDSARQLAGTMVAAADMADREEQPAAETKKDGEDDDPV
jgi:hypothetical protein